MISLFQDFLNLIFWNGCHGCGRSLTQHEIAICLNCFSQIEETHFHQKPQNNELYYKFAGKIALNGASSLFYFDKKGRVQKILHALKYHDQPEIGQILGEFWADSLQNSNFLEGIEAFVPVPLHNRKIIDRGYNQSECIAKGLSEITKIPVIPDLLKRVKRTEAQARKSRWDRWQNVENAFELTAEPPKGILLIDDVITTGATVEACLKAMSQSESAPDILKIGCIAVARPR